MRRLILPLLLVPLLAAAQNDAEPGWYEVELILFKQWEARGENSELWPKDAPDPHPEKLVQLGEPTDDLVAFSQLPRNRLRMQGIYKVLAASQSYEPLLHIGWRQQGLDRHDSPAVALPVGWKPSVPLTAAYERYSGRADNAAGKPPLYGIVHVFKERYLHASVDLRYRDRAPALASPNEDSSLYVHRQQRRMRSTGKLHYLDHPVLGVLVQLTPIEVPEKEPVAEEPEPLPAASESEAAD